MLIIRFFKIPSIVILGLFAFYSFATQAGTISVTPRAANAGTVGVNVPSDIETNFVVSNSATATSSLTVTEIIGTNEFLVVAPSRTLLLNGLTLAPGANFILSVKFRPAAAGNRSGNITIVSNDPVTPTTVLTATGYGGTETSIRLTPSTPFEIELGQGIGLRANVTFDNGATGPAILKWTSSNLAVATANAQDIDNSIGGVPVSSGNVTSKALGTTTITVSGFLAPLVQASVPITVVPATPHEFLGTSVSDLIVRVKNGDPKICYDFPEVDIDTRPVYDTHQIGVTTPSPNTIGSIYVTVSDSVITGLGQSEEIYHINACAPSFNPIVRTTIYNDPLGEAVFPDLVVDSTGNAVVTNDFGTSIWQLTPAFMSASLILRNGLPVDDIGSLAIDSFDNVYMSNLIRNPSGTQVEAAVYIRPKVFSCPGGTTWCPVAVVFGARDKSSTGVPGMAAIYEGSKGYAMKYIGTDKAIVERYVDLNGDGNYYNVNPATGLLVPDTNEVVEVAVIDAGENITVDANRNLIVSLSAPLGKTLVKMTDKSVPPDGDFKDPGEYRVIFQSNLFAQLKDIAFAAPCGEKPPIAVIAPVPPSGVTALDTPMLLLGNSSSDPCGDVLTYSWTNEDILTNPPVVCTTFDCRMTYTGLPAFHKVGLTVRDPAGNTNKAVTTVKAGPPVLNGFWPAAGRTGTGVFLFGKNFNVAPGTLPATTTVKFNNGTLLAGTFQKFGSDLIYLVQPAGVVVPAAGTSAGKITLTTAIGTAITSKNYNEVVPPGVAINGLWPSAAKKKAFVFLFGQGFAPGNVVTVNGVRTNTFQLLGSTLLIIQVPGDPLPPAPPLTTGPVCVTVTGNPPACSPTDLVIN